MFMLSYFTLMAMKTINVLLLKGNHWTYTYRSLRKMLILEQNIKRYLEAFASDLFICEKTVFK